MAAVLQDFSFIFRKRMKEMNRFLLIILMLLLTSTIVLARCHSSGSTEDDYKNTDEVFLGRVKNIRPYSKGRAEIIFSIIEQYKGNQVSEIKVYQQGNLYPKKNQLAERMFPDVQKSTEIESIEVVEDMPIFSMDEEWVVWANGKNDDLTVGACSRSKLLKFATQDLIFLQENVLKSKN